MEEESEDEFGGHDIESVDESDEFGGYDIEFVDELSQCQTCPICLLAMRDPVQTPCGHRFCESCLLKSFGDDVKVCPQDRNPLTEEQLFPDEAHKRNILSLRVKCKRSERGCDWTGELCYNEEHFNSCEYEDVTCNYCDNGVQRRLLHEHTTECLNRMVKCVHCEEEVVFRLKKSHEENDCPRFLCDCPQECGDEIPREEMDSHVRDECEMTMVFCPYQEGGCTFHGERRFLEEHIWNSINEHLSKTWSKLLETTERLNKLEVLKDQIEELRGDVATMRQQLENNRKEVSDVATMRQQFENNSKEISSLKQLVQTLMAKEEKRPDTPLNPLNRLEPIKQKSRQKSAIPSGSTYEMKETDNLMWPHSPSSPRVNRPKTAAATLTRGAGNIENENAKGDSSARSPSSPRVNRPGTAAATLPMIAGQTENENAKGKSLAKSPSSPRVNRPKTAAATLTRGAGSIENENAKGDSSAKSPRLPRIDRQTTATATLPMLAGQIENENAKGKSLAKRPSLLSPNRPNSAAAALPMGPGQIDYENGPGKSLVKRPSLLSPNRPNSAAAALPMGAGQIDNGNANGRSLVKRYGSSSDE